MASSGGEPSGEVRHERTYLRENTLTVDVLDITKVKAKGIIDSLCTLLGEGSVYTCVVKSSSTYEVTVADSDSLKLAVCGVKIGDNTYECKEVVQETVVVSFMNMSGYIPDSDIELKMKELGVELVSEIKRRLHPGTKVEDGTRYVRVKFPASLSSLPYSMKFLNGKVWEHVRVIHNDQTKVCRQCMSSEHLFRDCPEFVCFKCNRQGHIARMCQEPKCGECGRYGLNCSCDNRTIEECENCGKYDCQCEDLVCCVCEQSFGVCRCSPDDICKSCSVELRHCQCTVCDSCLKDDCVCVTDTDTREKPTTASDQSTSATNQPEQSRATDQPASGDAYRPGSPLPAESSPVTTTHADQTTVRQTDGNQPVDVSERESHPVDQKQRQLKQLVRTDEPSVRPMTILTRRRRLILEPNLNCVRKKQYIDRDINLE